VVKLKVMSGWLVGTMQSAALWLGEFTAR